MKHTRLVLSQTYYGEDLADLSQHIDDMMDDLEPSDNPDEMGMKGRLVVEIVQIWDEPDLPNHEFDFGE